MGSNLPPRKQPMGRGAASLTKPDHETSEMSQIEAINKYLCSYLHNVNAQKVNANAVHSPS